MINFDTCNFIIWGFRNSFHTHGYVNEGFYRALQHMGRDVQWLDSQSDLTQAKFDNTFIIGMNIVAMKDLDGLVVSENCFYAIHNIDDKVKTYFGDSMGKVKVMNFGVLNQDRGVNNLGSHTVSVGNQGWVSLQLWERYSSVIMPWGTNLLPHEVEANKAGAGFRQDSKEVNYIGSIGGDYAINTRAFAKACQENGIRFNTMGGYGNPGPPVSFEEHIAAIKRSYIAPTLTIPYQSEIGYIPCRIFKNISYGQMGVTCSESVNQFFGNKLIYNPNPYQLFYDAKERLPQVTKEELGSLMDLVAREHTYVNRAHAMIDAAKLVVGVR